MPDQTRTCWATNPDGHETEFRVSAARPPQIFLVPKDQVTLQSHSLAWGSVWPNKMVSTQVLDQTVLPAGQSDLLPTARTPSRMDASRGGAKDT